MNFLVDTNILSAHLRRPSGLSHRFQQHSGRICTSAICLGELFVWAFARQDPKAGVHAIDQLLHYEVSVVVYEQNCAEEFGRLRLALMKQGVAFDPVDLMIAATALVHDLILVTNNTRDFERIPNLRLNDWLTP